MTAAIKKSLVLNAFIVWVFLSLSTEKSKAKVGKNIEESKMFSLSFFFWCVWVGVQITSHSSFNHIFSSPLNAVGKTLKQLMEGETSNYIFFKVKQDSHLTSHHKIYSAVGMETVHAWDRSGTSQGWAGVIRSCETEWLCHPGLWCLLGTGPPCKITAR